MIEHLYTIIIVITYNFISYKPHLPKIYFAYYARTSFRDPSFDFESTERFRSFISLGTKSHIFGLR